MTVHDLLYKIKAFFHFVRRLPYRLVCWVNYPTSRERMWHMYSLGKVQGNKEALKEWPTARVQPTPLQPSKPRYNPPPLLPLHHTGDLVKEVRRQWQATGKFSISGPLRSMKQEAFHQPTPRRTVPLVPPIDHITTQRELVPDGLSPEVQKLFHQDASWLNDQKGEMQHDPFLVPLAVDDDATAETLPRLPVAGKRLTVRFDPRA